MDPFMNNRLNKKQSLDELDPLAQRPSQSEFGYGQMQMQPRFQENMSNFGNVQPHQLPPGATLLQQQEFRSHSQSQSKQQYFGGIGGAIGGNMNHYHQQSSESFNHQQFYGQQQGGAGQVQSQSFSNQSSHQYSSYGQQYPRLSANSPPHNAPGRLLIQVEDQPQPSPAVYSPRVESPQTMANNYPQNNYNNNNGSRRSSSSGPMTNLLSHVDGSMLLQEVFLHTSTLKDGQEPSISEEGIPSAIDLQGIWGKRNGTMLLSLRMKNDPRFAVNVTDFIMSFGKNCFGLTVQSNYLEMMPESGVVQSGETFGAVLKLDVSTENQYVDDPQNLLKLPVQIEYTIVDVRNQSKQRRLHFNVETLVPLHIFYLDHPQRQPVNDGRNNGVEDLTTLSTSDDGPRMTQSAFLSSWQSLSSPTSSHAFSVDKIPYVRWCNYFKHLQCPNKSMFIQSVVEHKLAINRVYQVASRQVPGDAGAVQYVLYGSFRIGIDAGQLVMSEIRLTVPADVSMDGSAQVTLKGQINPHLWAGLERSIRGILLS
ncbi:hypothetical protein MP228_007002 [Amoeboaphelidium protococcarum]|nr:hypothetical protein MP228_007002 [Amoeboaphelidium protococcarum]